MFHCQTDALQSANARGRAVLFRWAAVSQAVDQSSRRNKRNDRLAKGHDRVAGAGMVLRTASYTAPLGGGCHYYFHRSRYFPKCVARRP
jgi:hypothetical protein